MIIFEHGLLASTSIRIDCYGTGSVIDARSSADNELNAAGGILIQAWLDGPLMSQTVLLARLVRHFQRTIRERLLLLLCSKQQ